MSENSNIFTEIEKTAKELGFPAVGYTAVKPLAEEARRYHRTLEQGFFAGLDYLKRNNDKRFNPALLVEGAQSILVFLAPYGENKSSEYLHIQFPQQTEKYKVAQYAAGEDYHRVIKQKLQKVFNRITELKPGTTGRIFVDTAPVLERAWAVKAGLGFIGKNNFLISRQYGIRNFIGVIILNILLPERENNPASPGRSHYCGTCTRCLDACPTGALSAPYTLDARKCISYLTIEEKDTTPLRNKELAGERDNWIFGCDACMNACPWNSKNLPGWPEFSQQIDPLPSTHLKRR